jgi:hypothetical protein
MANNEVLLWRRGFYDPVTVPVLDVNASWDLTGRGSLSALMTRSTYADLPFETILGLWVTWDTPVGLWGGQVMRVPYHLGSRYVELSCSDFRSLLDERRVGTADFAGMTPGSIVRRALSEVNNEDPLLIDDFVIDVQGEPIAYQFRDDMLANVISTIADQTGNEWRIAVQSDLRLRLEFQQQLGENKADRIRLVEGLQIVDGDYTPSKDGVINDYLGIAGDEDHANATRHVEEHRPSIQRYGRMQGVKEFPGLVFPSVLVPVMRAELAKTREPSGALNLTVIDTSPYVDDFIEGDSIRVMLTSSNEERLMRVLTRSYGNRTFQIAGTSEDLE